jgi:hypothetical protein
VFLAQFFVFSYFTILIKSKTSATKLAPFLSQNINWSMEVNKMYYVDTTDERNITLKELLEENKQQVKSFSWELKIEKHSICVFSPAKKFSTDMAENLPNDTVLYAGNLPLKVQEIIKNKNITYHNLMDDETFTIKNANLTCEGVLALILCSSKKSIYENNVLILGGGRIAKAMAVMLGRLGVNYAMVSFNKIKFPEYFLYSNKCYFGYSFVDALEDYDVIVNTIPAQIIDDAVISKIAPDTAFIETASVDCLKKEKVNNFKYIKAPGLPRRYCPKAAGKLMYENIMGENKYD